MKDKTLFLIIASLMALITALLLASGCANPNLSSSASSPKDLPPGVAPDASLIKIGVLLPLTGKDARLGESLSNAMQLALDFENNQLDGHPVKLVIEDEGENDAALALIKAQKLVESDKVNLIVGPYYSSSALAVLPYTSSIPMIDVLWTTPASAQETDNQFAFWTAPRFQDSTYPLGLYTFDKGFRTVTSLGSDDPIATKFMEGFVYPFQYMGGKLIQQQWAPVSAADFTPFLNNVIPANAFVSATLGDAAKVTLFNQYASLGLFKKMPVFLAETDSLTPAVMQEIGDNVIGTTGVERYLLDLNNIENKKFVLGYQQRYQENPDSQIVDAYNSLKVVIAALKSSGENTAPETLKSALLNTAIDLPTGAFRFSSNRIGVQPVRICQVAKENGQYIWKVVQEYPPAAYYQQPSLP